MNKKLIAVFMTMGIIMTSGVQAFAAPITDAEKAEIKQEQQEFEKAEDKLNGLEAELQELDSQIGGLQDKLNENKATMNQKEKDIQTIKKDIDKATQELKEKQEIFDTRMRAIYKSGSPGYLELIIKAEGMSDLFSKVKAIGKLMDFDKKIIEELNDTKLELDNKKQALDNEVKSLNELKIENEKQLSEVNIKKQDQKKLVDKAKEESDKIKVNLKEKERKIIAFQKNIITDSSSSSDDIKSAIAALRETRKTIVVIDEEVVDLIEKGKEIIKNKEAAAKTSSIVPSRGGSNAAPASSNSIVNYAYNFMGVPYVYGGTKPSGFDCSGFTSYVYNAFGYGIGRTTYDQIGGGTPVSYNDLQPGDLVFTNGVGHVGIYVGGGQMIHAPRTGRNVEVGPIYGFSSARRVLK
ncbi:NlpC/P60 family protein [Clostridium algidicarnis]|uniref:C40 family peptidase n=1 Tax=Clostridium algidicarnis TaxID=37659 RepID=UPI001C0D8283|nr:C40 family peptidase [Clostridium algidicarnis]MBU3194477.1 C40 family peptidase [Clostridium algidicarnis]MBU3197419.1 C40 family peptidase [Clostridium algidicarnis]MBU3207596.1 C40 family peptidase [Clostridium algidicarnis]MCB2287744.1 NlpC/P60 family protein [Clostridium algidicarnis]